MSEAKKLQAGNGEGENIKQEKDKTEHKCFIWQCKDARAAVPMR